MKSWACFRSKIEELGGIIRLKLSYKNSGTCFASGIFEYCIENKQTRINWKNEIFTRKDPIAETIQ